jgi:hypothetical protein
MSRIRNGTLAALIAGIAIPGSVLAADAAASAAPLAHAAARPAVEVCGAGAPLVRPGSMILACADDGELAEHLHWSTWTRARASASGTVTWRNWTAATAATVRHRGWESTRAQFTLTDPVSEPGGRLLFTRLHVHVTGHTPPGFMRNLTYGEAPEVASAARPAPFRTQKQAPVRAHSAASAPSGTLSYADIEGYWIAAGGPDGNISVPQDPAEPSWPYGTFTVAQVAAAITGAESSLEPGNIQPDVDYCDAGADRAGWGLWQITCGNEVPSYGTDFQVLDPWNNAEAAVSLYNASEFGPWTTYTSLAYQQYLEDVAPATGLTDPGQYVQVHSTPSGTPASPAADPGSTYGPPMPGTSPAPSLIGNVSSAGAFDVKENGLSGGWTQEEASGVASIALASDSSNGPLLGYLSTSGAFYVKQGSLSSGWTQEEPSGVAAIALASDGKNGALLGYLSTSGAFYVKEGNNLSGGWTQEASSGVAAIAVASDSQNGPLLGYLSTSGAFDVKQGSLSAGWTQEEPSGVASIALASDSKNGALLGYDSTSGAFYVKEGNNLSGGWTQEQSSGVAAIALASDASNGPLLGYLSTSGAFDVKETSLSNGWTQEASSGAASIALASDGANGPLLGYDSTSGVFDVKAASLSAGWTQEEPSGTASIALAPGSGD